MSAKDFIDEAQACLAQFDRKVSTVGGADVAVNTISELDELRRLIDNTISELRDVKRRCTFEEQSRKASHRSTRRLVGRRRKGLRGFVGRSVRASHQAEIETYRQAKHLINNKLHLLRSMKTDAQDTKRSLREIKAQYGSHGLAEYERRTAVRPAAPPSPQAVQPPPPPGPAAC